MSALAFSTSESQPVSTRRSCDASDELAGRPKWMDRAACRGRGHSEFVIYASATPSAVVLAMCAECAVKDDCLAYAVLRPDLVGVWGGTTERERRQIRRQRRAVA
jgi:WhiB family transcriptional regulator, redox-sensing transcriptional regulator